MIYSNVFINADEAFVELYDAINSQPISENDTRRILNVCIKILHPENNLIKTEFRGWSKTYAEREWQWYLSKNRSVEDIKKYAKIWDNMHSGDNIVNSNYGYLWDENNQIDKIIQQLKENKTSRQAWITLYDGKRKDEYKYDTPCTLNIGFNIDKGLLNMSVLMRSNDLWFGFCNDQYCFSKLQMVVAQSLKLDVGWYYHYAADMHLYKRHFNMK